MSVTLSAKLMAAEIVIAARVRGENPGDVAGLSLDARSAAVAAIVARSGRPPQDVWRLLGPGPTAAFVEVGVAAKSKVASYVSIPKRVAIAIEAHAATLFLAHPEGAPVEAVMAATGASYYQTTVALCALHRAGKFSWDHAKYGVRRKVLRPSGAPVEAALTENQATILGLLCGVELSGMVRADRCALRNASGLAMATVDLCVHALRRKGHIQLAPESCHEDIVAFRVLRPTTPIHHQAMQPAPPKPAPLPPKVDALALIKPDTPPAPRMETMIPVRVSVPPLAPTPAPVALSSLSYGEAWMMLESPARSLLSLRPGMCKWPLDNHPPGEMHLTTFCCAPQGERGVYCAIHEGAA